ncbi:MAG: PilZ domain-containing protein [Cellvibrionaceae bacterium]|nr:PilZ domain-containing protein [Cellvibrionaceae bacterium]
MDERRKLERRELNISVVAHHGVDDEALGKLVNLHREGLMIMSPGPLQLDQIYQLDLQLPEPIDNVSLIPLIADCMWQSPANSEGAHWVGFKIVELSHRSADLIDRLV